MDLYEVEGPLVCTRRIAGLKHVALRVLRDAKGRRSVATDPVGARAGNQVFTVAGSAARYAQGENPKKKKESKTTQQSTN
jgi:carboxysome peptide B